MQNTHPDASVPQILGFEGPEKKLEIDFVFLEDAIGAKKKGLRALNGEKWQERVLDKAKCTIISTTVNKHFDSYVLSESSLFVYPTKILLKTCGTTTLLNAVEPILQIASELGLGVLHVIFSRKNFIFPHVQPAPHKSWEEEVKFLDAHFEGSSFVIGPQNHDHWYLYYADYSDQFPQSKYLEPEVTLEIMMHDLCPKKMKQFFKDPKTFKSSAHVTKTSGIGSLLPGSVIDDFQFDPCGYSMNGLFNETYWTIHITPEDHCSYVSFETNASPAMYNKKNAAEFYDWLITNVMEVFRPGRATITLFADDHLPHFCKTRKTSSCFDQLLSKLSSHYNVRNRTLYELEGGCNLSLCNVTQKPKKEPAQVPQKKKVDMAHLSEQLKGLGLTVDDLQEAIALQNKSNVKATLAEPVPSSMAAVL